MYSPDRIHSFIRVIISNMNITSRQQRPVIVADRHIPYLKGRLEPFAEVIYIDQEEFTPEAVKDADALLVRTRTRCGRSLLKGSRCRLACTATIGLDHFDLPWLRNAGIEAHNAPGCNAPGVAQYVWGGILDYFGDVRGLKVGVVGKGNVGSIVVDWGRKLGAEVLVCDPPRQEAGKKDEEYLPLNRLMEDCDVVTFHTPFERSGAYPTFHLANSENMSLMRPGTLLINAARGGVVDNVALKALLKEGKIKAIIDTWEHEPALDPELLPLVEAGTPHIAGYSLEGKQRATRMVLEAVGRFFGWQPDLSGLEPDYIAPLSISPEEISSGYSPKQDSCLLQGDHKDFDTLRAEYVTRAEPRFRDMPKKS